MRESSLAINSQIINIQNLQRKQNQMTFEVWAWSQNRELEKEEIKNGSEIDLKKYL